MPVIGTVDPATKRIQLAVGVREYHPVDDLYRELRALRRTDETLRPFDMPLVASGNVAKGGGKFTPRLVTFRDGWRVVPEDVSHTLTVTGEQITDDGQSGPAAIDFTPLSTASKVVVQYEPPAAEIIEVATGSGVTEQDKADIAVEVRTELDAQSVKLGLLDAAISSRAAPGNSMGILASHKDDIALKARVEVLDNSSVDALSLAELLRLMASVWAGDIVITGDNYSLRARGNPTRERIAATVDSDGNRTITAVDVDP